MRTFVLLLLGFSPGTWDIDFVRLSSPSSVTFVFVCDLLNVPLSIAWALDCPCRCEEFSFTFDRLFAFPSAVAALPPTPIDEVVPSSVLQVPAVPSVLADVLPAAEVPPEPTVAAASHSCAGSGNAEQNATATKIPYVDARSIIAPFIFSV